jgi:large subunit ribosomal protein L30
MAGTKAIAKIKLQYFRSKICTPVKHKLVIKVRGMVAKVPHLVRVVE